MSTAVKEQTKVKESEQTQTETNIDAELAEIQKDPYAWYLDLNHYAENEKELYRGVQELFGRIEDAEHRVLRNYWRIGELIMRFKEEKKPSSFDACKKVAEELGLHEGTLRKACQFAKKFGPADLKTLEDGNGRFTMSWHLLTQSLPLETEDILKEYQTAPTKKDFYNTVINLRQEISARRKKPPKADTPTTDAGKLAIPKKKRADINETILSVEGKVHEAIKQIRELTDEITTYANNADLAKDEYIEKTKAALKGISKQFENLDLYRVALNDAAKEIEAGLVD